MICDKCDLPMMVGSIWPYDYYVCFFCGNVEHDVYQDDGDADEIVTVIDLEELPA